MKNLLLLVLFSASAFASNAQTADWAWAKTADNNNVSEATYVCADANNNVYVAGYFLSDTITFGATVLVNDTTNGSNDMFVVKYDANGNVLWAKSAGGSKDDAPGAIATDAAGNVYIAGTYTSRSVSFGSTTLTNSTASNDMYLVKYNTAGNIEWAKSVSTDNNVIPRTLTTYAGGIYVAGYYGGSTITFGATTLTNNSAVNGSNIFLAKYDNTGNVQWAKGAGGDTRDYAFAVVAATGGICLTGSYASTTITFGTTTLPNSAGAGTLNLYLVKYDTSGNVTWAKNTSADDNIFCQALSADATGNLYVTGFFYSTNFTVGSTTLVNNGIHDMFVIKYDASGTPVWAKNSVTDGNTYAGSTGIANDASGNTYVIGSFSSDSINFGSVKIAKPSSGNLFIVKYDANGNPVWGKSPAGSGNSLCSDVSGNICLAGSFTGSSISLGSITVNNPGNYLTMFVAKYGSASTGVKTVSNMPEALTIYPNPSTGKFIAQLNTNKSTATIEVYNVMGKMVYQNYSPTSKLFQVDLSAQPSGLYFVQVMSEGNFSTQKMLINK